MLSRWVQREQFVQSIQIGWKPSAYALKQHAAQYQMFRLILQGLQRILFRVHNFQKHSKRQHHLIFTTLWATNINYIN